MPQAFPSSCLSGRVAFLVFDEFLDSGFPVVVSDFDEVQAGGEIFNCDTGLSVALCSHLSKPLSTCVVNLDILQRSVQGDDGQLIGSWVWKE